MRYTPYVLAALIAMAVPVMGANLTLSWTDNSDNEDGFKIERSEDGEEFVEIATVGPNVTTYTDIDLPVLTSFWYRVRAFNTEGDSEYSNIATNTTTTNVLVNSGFEVYDNSGSEGSRAVGWDANWANGTSVTLEEDTDGRTGSAQKISVSAVASWGWYYAQTINLDFGQVYTWSFWYKTDGTQSVTGSVTNASHSQFVFDTILEGTSGEWRNANRIFVYTNTSANTIRLASSSTGDFWVDDMTLMASEELMPPEPPRAIKLVE